MESLSLLQLNKRIASLVMTPATANVWVTAELSDVAVRGGHCYMELLQKDPASGATVAKARAAIWANQFAYIRSDFYAATGQDFRTGLKVMVRASVSMHPVYGMSLVINAVNPDYTMGDILRRRNEMLARLKQEGIIDLNRSLELTEPPLRVAVISAEGAAGYGDFMNQLTANPLRLRFTTALFPAVMQGEKAAATIISALEKIAMQQEKWDCVVIIRGGGATSDLLGFEDYNLASHVAQFPLPVIVGIGHERDVTILDYVACARVKTPTAAAEWLIAQGKDALDRLELLGQQIVSAAREHLSGCKEQLGMLEGRLPSLATAMVDRASSRLDRYTLALQQTASRHLAPKTARLDALQSSLRVITEALLQRRMARLDALAQMLDALSPQATLRRGYSITRAGGKVVTSAEDIPAGTVLTTTLASGKIISVKQ